MTITIRNYDSRDLQAIITMINANDAIEKIEDGTSMEEMQAELESPDLNPEQNIFVGEDENGKIVAYAWSRLHNEPAESTFRTWFVVHPDARPSGLETRMLDRLYHRANERLPECTNNQVSLHTIANLLERNRIAVVEQFGMWEIRRFWQMVRPLDAPIPEPQFLKGVILRAYRVKDDDEKMHAAHNEAFRDHFGHSESTPDRWVHYVNQPFFRPDLTIVAEDKATGEVAGYCAVIVNREENKRIGIQRGWIDLLGVRRPWRKHGLGTALLLKGMHDFREAGLTQAALGCDSENPTGATRIYERVGFSIAKTRVAFRKPLRGAQ